MSFLVLRYAHAHVLCLFLFVVTKTSNYCAFSCFVSHTCPRAVPCNVRRHPNLILLCLFMFDVRHMFTYCTFTCSSSTKHPLIKHFLDRHYANVLLMYPFLLVITHTSTYSVLSCSSSSSRPQVRLLCLLSLNVPKNHCTSGKMLYRKHIWTSINIDYSYIVASVKENGKCSKKNRPVDGTL